MKYTTPEMEIVRFEEMEVLAASGLNDDIVNPDVQGD